MKFGAKLLVAFALSFAFAGCSHQGTTDSGATSPSAGGPVGAGSGSKPLVYFSQANSADPWRQVFDAETKSAAADHVNQLDFEMTTASGDSNTQINQIETELVKKPKVMLVSPDTQAVKSAIDKAFDSGVKVILLDRSVPGEKFDCYVGGDNHAIGFQAGQYLGKKLAGKGTILMIQGKAATDATTDRANGFNDAMKGFPGIKVIAGENCDYERQKAEAYMENFLQSHQAFDAVYAHNDEMAIGAYLAMEHAKAPKKVIVGIDGCQQEIVDMIKAGKIDASFSYPDPGPKGVEIAAGMINGQMPPSKRVLLSTDMITKETADAYAAKHPNLAK